MSKLFGEGNPIRRRFAANTGWLIAQSVFQYVLTAIIGIIAARYLGPSNYGVLTYGVSLMAIFQAFCTLGFNDVQITDMIENPSETGAVVGTATTLRLASSLLSVGGITLAAMILRPGQKLLVLVTMLQSLQLIFISFDTMRLWFQMKLMSKYTAIGSIIGNVACSVWRVVLLVRGASVEWFALTSVIQMLANYLFVAPLFFAKSGLKLSFSFSVGKRLLGRSWHYILSALTAAVAAHIGKLILGAYLGDAVLGYYNAAYTIAMMWLFVPLAVVDSALPVLLSTKKNNPDAFVPRYQLVLMLVFGIGVAAGLFLTIFAPFVVNLLYGKDYAEAAKLLRILAWIGIFSNVGSARGVWIQAEGKQRVVKYISALCALMSIALSFLLIPAWGAVGAALACLGGFLVSSFIASIILKDTRPFVRLWFGSFGTVFSEAKRRLAQRRA